MAASLNKVYLMGNLTRDPELKYIPSGSAVANFSMALNRSYTTPSGDKKDNVCFVNIVAWTKLAEICGEYLVKGSAVLVEGRLQSRSWEAENGQKRSVLEVVAENIQFIGRKPAGDEPRSTETPAQEKDSMNETIDNQPMEEEIPF